jgi:hypothetical protein
MPRSVVAVAALLALAGCVTTELSPRARLVRVTSSGAVVRDCKFIGDVQASDRMNGGWLGMDAAEENTERRMKNRAAAMGGNVILLNRTDKGYFGAGARGEVYDCGGSTPRLATRPRLAEGMKVYAPNGDAFGTIQEIQGDVVSVRLVHGGDFTMTTREAVERLSASDRATAVAGMPDDGRGTESERVPDPALGIGTILYDKDGSVFGAIDQTAPDHTFDDGSSGPAVRVKVAAGGYRWIRAAEAANMTRQSGSAQ